MLDGTLFEKLMTVSKDKWTEAEWKEYHSTPYIFVEVIDDKQKNLEDNISLDQLDSDYVSSISSDEDFWVRNKDVLSPV